MLEETIDKVDQKLNKSSEKEHNLLRELKEKDKKQENLF